VRRALYVLFARLLAEPPDAALYARLRTGGLRTLAEAQGLELTSDLLDEEDAEAAASELNAEYVRLLERVSLRASDYTPATGDATVAVLAYLREHGLRVDERARLPADHLSVALGVMGELAAQAESGGDGDAGERARAFFLRHIQPWAQRALAEVASRADRRFYRGLAAMVSAFLESEHRAYRAA
jgi:TorA maturation chaperone TorD